jgi:restriction system protein
MARRRSFVSSLAAMQRAADQAARARARAAREQERQHRRVFREHQRLAVAQAKDKIRLFHEAQETEAAERNEDLTEAIDELTGLLADSIGRDHRLQYEKLKAPLVIPSFEQHGLEKQEPAPRPDEYLPQPLGFFSRLIPGSRAKFEKALRKARERFDSEVAAHASREQRRRADLAAALANYNEAVRRLNSTTARQHDEIDTLQRSYEAGQTAAVRQYFEAVLASLTNPPGCPERFKVAYIPESKQLVVEYDLPGFEIVPDTAAYKYISARKEIVATRRPASDRRRLYTQVIAQATLRTIHVLFSSDYGQHVESLVFNGHVDSIDQATGHRVHPCLVTIRTTGDVFVQLDLAKVEPEACLRGLNASVSKNPDELAPVKPVLEFDMVDPRFVEEEDIISGLDNRTNLMDLSPRQFESLITNLFEKMGLETRQTRPSRDGGVDCVAYDPRPIFGGKVVIQAKRYKNTVGVSAVRDLYGTVQNEGASKGILVTTSGFGRASFEFAEGKPLELLSGSNLLYLLAEHAGVEAKIEVPEDWKDPSPDSPE